MYQSSYDSSYQFLNETTKVIASEISYGEETQASLLAVTTTLITEGPDDAGPSGGAVDVIADAFGTGTIAAASISGELVADGTATTMNFDSLALAVSVSPESGMAQAVALTDAYVDHGNNVLFVATVEQELSIDGPDGSASIAVSETTVVGIDTDLSQIGVGSGDDGDDTQVDEPVFFDPDIADTDVSIDGNTALIDVDVTVIAPESFVSIEYSTLTIEDELSTVIASVSAQLDIF